jgi:hypothetical protein
MKNTESPNTAADGPVQPGTMMSADDMHDNPQQWSLLAARLEECRQIVEPVFEKADAAALRHQRKHQWLTKIAAVAGTIAVVWVIMELPWLRIEPEPKWILTWVEPLAALIALVAVVLGLVVSQLDSWLVERHKAERCRLLKFAFLTDPVIWGGDEQRARDRVSQLRREVADLSAVQTIEEPRNWLAQVHFPAFLNEERTDWRDQEALRQLIAYYRGTRLHVQIAYFNDRIKRFAFQDRFTRILPQWLFFTSVFAAFVHFVLEYVEGRKVLEVGHTAALVSALVAAILPVLGAGIRTFRMANEFGRNVRRFESTEHVLKDKDRLLEQGVDANTVFHTLWECEHALEIEHQEWLRLMADTEWFG